jgi:arylsulfatase A-like enzyme
MQPLSQAAALALMALCPPAAQALPTDPLPGQYNVVLLLLDDLGWDKLSTYTPACPIPTPHLSQLAAQGIRFNRAYVSPVCSPTRAEIMTGQHGFRTGMRTHIVEICGVSDYQLADSNLFLSELLRDGFGVNGPNYARGAFGKWHMTREPDPSPMPCTLGDDCHPVRNGFEEFRGFRSNNADHFVWTKVVATLDGSSCNTNASVVSGTTGLDGPWDGSVTRFDALQWIAGLPQGRPFFAMVSFNPPHHVFQVPPHHLLTGTNLPPERAIGTEPVTERQYYDLMVEAIDREVGNFVAGLPPNTVVFVIGDNGTPSEEIDYGQVGYTMVPSVPRGKRTLYELGARVPMIVWGPIVAPQHQGTQCDGLVNAVDVFVTAARVAGLSEAQITAQIPCRAPGCAPCGTGDCQTGCVDSVSFLHMLQDPAAPSKRRYAYTEASNINGCVADNCNPSQPFSLIRALVGRLSPATHYYKYLRKRPCPSPSGSDEEFYDLTDDPLELVNKIGMALSEDEVKLLGLMRSEMNALSGP